MLRVLMSVSQRAKKLPHAVLLAKKSIDHSLMVQSKLRRSQPVTLQLARCFASGGDERIKGSAGTNQGGIIGSIGSQATMGQASSAAGDAATIEQMQNTAFGSRGDQIGKRTDGATKSGTVTSHMQATTATSPPAECGKIGTDESVSASKCSKGTEPNTSSSGSSGGGQSTGSSVGNLAEDAVKQLQEAAANLPSKAQVEKFVFRVLAFLYDIIYLTGTWSIRFVNEKILQNTTVKYYWKRFHEKMDQAKKD